nr:immunoglobulin heavy chain junction region [Macaca mulatta]
CVILMLGYW